MKSGQFMESEIRRQPEVLASRCHSYFDQIRERIAIDQVKMVVIAARGSSDHAALFLRYLIEIHLHLPVSLAAPSVVTRFRGAIEYPEKTLGIGISQSGAGPDVAQVLANLKEQGHPTIAITNSPESLLAHSVRHVVDLAVPAEQSVAATGTYTASLLAAYQLVRALGGPLPDPAPHLPTERTLEESQAAAEAALGPVLRSAVLLCLGRGYHYCSALETSLKFMDCALLPAKGFSSADFQHGPRALASYGSCALVFGEVPENLDAHGALVVQAPVCSESVLAPVHEILFGQWLALLAARARGLNPDAPPALTKVTRTF